MTFDPSNKLLPVPKCVVTQTQHTGAHFTTAPSQEAPVTGCVTLIRYLSPSSAGAKAKLGGCGGRGGASDQPTGRGNARAGETAHVKTSRSEAKSERTEHARQHRVRRKENQGELRRRGGSNTKFPATLCSLKSTV